MKVTGRCHCGHITYEAEVDPATVRVCHCTDCQKLTGTVFRAAIASLPGTFGTEQRDTEGLHQDRGKREATRPRLLPGLRHTDLRHRGRAKPVDLWTTVRRH